MFEVSKAMSDYAMFHPQSKFVQKSWGWETWYFNTEDFCMKELFVKKGKYCSFHYHKLKKELFFIKSGKIDLRYGWEDCKIDDVFDIRLAKLETLEEGDHFYIPNLLRHRFYALKDTYIIETSTQHSEEDVYRIQKGS